MFNIIRDQWSKWNLKEDGNLIKNLKKRGVDDTDALPKYHYRDDSVLLWKAINDYVALIVNHVYGKSVDKRSEVPRRLVSSTVICCVFL